MQKQLHLFGGKQFVHEVRPVVNDEMSAFRKKPANTTGLWTSTWDEETQESDWVSWCVYNDFGDPYGERTAWYLLTPQEGVKLYVVDSYADLRTLLERYAYIPAYLKHYQHLDDLASCIDFERLAQNYDGMHLTRRGNAQCHLSYPYDLNSWDAESTLWFRWCFSQVERIATPVRLQEVD